MWNSWQKKWLKRLNEEFESIHDSVQDKLKAAIYYQHLSPNEYNALLFLNQAHVVSQFFTHPDYPGAPFAEIEEDEWLDIFVTGFEPRKSYQHILDFLLLYIREEYNYLPTKYKPPYTHWVPTKLELIADCKMKELITKYREIIGYVEYPKNAFLTKSESPTLKYTTREVETFAAAFMKSIAGEKWRKPLFNKHYPDLMIALAKYLETARADYAVKMAKLYPD